jgi:quercetin dioxygenase-like cupin family protein
MSSCEHGGNKAAGSLAPAEVQQLSSTVEVADAAIVSRTLMKTNGGTVTVFAFDQGQALSEHTAPFDALVQVLEGTLTVSIDGKEYSLERGDVVLMPADIPHGVTALTQVKWMLVMLKAGGES